MKRYTSSHLLELITILNDEKNKKYKNNNFIWKLEKDIKNHLEYSIKKNRFVKVNKFFK